MGWPTSPFWVCLHFPFTLRFPLLLGLSSLARFAVSVCVPLARVLSHPAQPNTLNAMLSLTSYSRSPKSCESILLLLHPKHSRTHRRPTANPANPSYFYYTPNIVVHIEGPQPFISYTHTYTHTHTYSHTHTQYQHIFAHHWQWDRFTSRPQTETSDFRNTPNNICKQIPSQFPPLAMGSFYYSPAN